MTNAIDCINTNTCGIVATKHRHAVAICYCIHPITRANLSLVWSRVPTPAIEIFVIRWRVNISMICNVADLYSPALKSLATHS